MPSLASVARLILTRNRLKRALPIVLEAAPIILKESKSRASRFRSRRMADQGGFEDTETMNAAPSVPGGTDTQQERGTPNPSPPLPGDGSYEVVLSALGTLLEKTPRAKPVSGVVQFIQGAVSANAEDGFYAFVSVQDVNIPLVASEPSRSLGPFVFEINIPSRKFELTLDNRTEMKIITGVEDILRWFTTYEGTHGPGGNSSTSGQSQYSMDEATADAMAAGAEDAPIPAGGKTSALKKTQSALDRAGVKGAELITKYGEKINDSIKTKADEAVAKNGGNTPKEVKLGGSATAGALSGAKKVAGTGAGIAAIAIDRVSTAIGNGLACNKVAVSMREAPENTVKHQVHDLLVAGAMAIGRVYIAADDQGKLIIESLGDGAGRVAGTKYGAEAESAARALGHISLDTYRILRFPQKLGATSLVKGALKGAEVAHECSNPSSVPVGLTGGMPTGMGGDGLDSAESKPVVFAATSAEPSAPPK